MAISYQDLDGIIDRLEQRRPISTQNSGDIRRFKEDCIVRGLMPSRISKYLFDLWRLCEWLGKDFAAAGLDDFRSLVARIESSGCAEWTKHGFKVELKIFVRYLRGALHYPPEVAWVSTRMRKSRQLLPQSLLTPEDVAALISAADHPRDRAFIAVLYESGARVGEVLGLQLGHLTFDDWGAVMTVHGKTGARRVRLVTSVPYLAEWINKHPRAKDPAAALWVSRDKNLTELTYACFAGVLKRAKVRAGIMKPINFHHFRHSRATFLAGHLTEAQMKEYLGWVQSSEMAAVYVHLSGRDVDNAILRMHGAPDTATRQPDIEVRTCMRCKTANAYTNSFCSKCGLAVDERAVVQVLHADFERRSAREWLAEVFNDPFLREELMRRLRS